MAKYKPKVGDKITFNRATSSKKAPSAHTGTITWIASNGKFMTLYPHSMIINNAMGVPIECAATIETTDIIGLST